MTAILDVKEVVGMIVITHVRVHVAEIAVEVVQIHVKIPVHLCVQQLAVIVPVLVLKSLVNY
ncbi:hypothetical protein EQM13_07550 [Acidilutibacter cellobiosedens]|uniref:Uncharacterized protein n=1 Tax=Acidilutibacter cellobiosedens TaxID=2507161 RepID=A0A410QBN3_9FIRM|nr:hypothetical protein [Acidilutibacter cellobiosedens]QAT61442.1 hypothetical protein EQM13_07550 [Acidilutibacter cellobiosedens]